MADITRGQCISWPIKDMGDNKLSSESKLNVLVLQSDARDTHRLRLAEEQRELSQAIRRTQFGQSLNLYCEPSCRIRDITAALDRHQPNVLHFRGHGESGELFFEDDHGRAAPVLLNRFARLLETQPSLKLVILNAGYSQDQAQGIADAVGYAVGVNGAILDQDAINFSREFYTALGHGRTVEDAFDRAEAAVRLSSDMEMLLFKRQYKPEAGPLVPATNSDSSTEANRSTSRQTNSVSNSPTLHSGHTRGLAESVSRGNALATLNSDKMSLNELANLDAENDSDAIEAARALY